MKRKRRPRRPAGWARSWHVALSALLLAAVGWAAYVHRTDMQRAGGLISHAAFWWLVPAAIMIGGVYLCRAMVYQTPLRLLGYSVSGVFLWSTALVATAIHQLIPAGGASGYAYLTYAFMQAGASGARASLTALIDTLSYAVAVATLVIASLIYVSIVGSLRLGSVAWLLIPGIVLVAAAVGVFVLQRDEARLIRLVLGVKDWVAARLSRASWSDQPVRRFLRQYYEAKDIIGTHRSSWYRMVALQYVAFGCDCTAVYMACLSLGLAPKPWIIVMGFVFAMAGLSVITAPGGGGSFEVILSAFLSRHGLAPGEAIAVAVLYRVVAFWIPVLVSVVLLYRKQRARLRRQR